MDSVTAGLVLAGLAVIGSTLTGLIAPWWTRKTERERWEVEREAERQRWERQERSRRIQRGEDAANDLIGVIDLAAAHMRSQAKYHQSEYAQFYRDIRRIALLLTDEGARHKVLEIAECFYFFDSTVHTARSLSHLQGAYEISAASHDILHAYLMGEPPPSTPRFDRLFKLVDDGSKWISHQIGEDEPDDLDEPEVSAAAQDAEGSGSA